MKKLFVTLTLGLLAHASFAQSLPNYDEIKLVVKEDYNATANDAALQAANYLLSTPLDGKNIDRLKCMQYVIKWMAGSPDYYFTLDAQATKFSKKNDDLMALYMAAMTKYVLENKEYAADQNKIKLNAVKLIVDYAKNPDNKVKLNSELKKLIEADSNGNLAEYLKV